MKSDSGKVLFFILFLTLSAMTVVAGTIKGTVTDKQTREPLTGATIQIALIPQHYNLTLFISS